VERKRTIFNKNDPVEYDSLDYDGGNLMVSADNTYAAKIDGCYYARYSTTLSRWLYVLKRGGIIYYKTDATQTYWTEARSLAATPAQLADWQQFDGVIDPEELFNLATSYKMPHTKSYYETQYGVVFTVANTTYSGPLNLHNWANSGHTVLISYYDDGWVSHVYAYERPDIPSLRLAYHKGVSWKHTQVNTTRIVVR
jgi:hypothetical protein